MAERRIVRRLDQRLGTGGRVDVRREDPGRALVERPQDQPGFVSPTRTSDGNAVDSGASAMCRRSVDDVGRAVLAVDEDEVEPG